MNPPTSGKTLVGGVARRAPGVGWGDIRAPLIVSRKPSGNRLGPYEHRGQCQNCDTVAPVRTLVGALKTVWGRMETL